MSIEHCPRCSARVRVPAAAEPESWVRCPRCRVETQLSELLAAEPPELELIDGPSGVVPEYAPLMTGAEGEEFNEFEVTSADTLVSDEDSPTLPAGGLALDDNFLDEETDQLGAAIGRVGSATTGDDELFGFDDNPDVAALRTTSNDGKLIEVPTDGDEEFNLSGDDSASSKAAPFTAAGLGAGLTGIPSTMPRRKKKSGMVPMMIGVVGGGLFGILIAYYGILMWAMEMDPFKVAKYFPDSMQMLLPAKLQNKTPLASKLDSPPADPDNTPSENPTPDSDPSTPSTDNGSGDSGSNPTTPSTDPTAPTPDPSATPTTDPLDPLAMLEKPMPAKPATDPLDPFGNTAPVPPTDPLGNPEAPVKPADPLGNPDAPVKPPADPLDPFGNNAPIKPEVTTPADPLDPLNPGTPVPLPNPEVTTPAPVDPLDPLSAPVKPEMPAKPEVTTPTPDPLDPLAPQPADPLAAPATPKASEPLMLASASFAPSDLEASLTQATASYDKLAQNPEDKTTQIASYRALSRLGEVAGQLKSLGETPEKSAEHLKALQTTSKKLAADPSVAGVAKWTSMWLTVAPEKRNNGIVLQGIPGTSEQAGKYHRTNLDVPGTDQKLTIVSEHPLLPNADGKVTILGVIVDKPAEQIPGYPGPAERVIWVSVGEMEQPATAPAGDAPPAPAKVPADDPFGEIK